MSEGMTAQLRDMPQWKQVNRDGTKPWTQEEVTLMFEMVANKRTNKEISEALDRSLNSVIGKLYNLTQRGVRFLTRGCLRVLTPVNPPIRTTPRVGPSHGPGPARGTTDRRMSHVLAPPRSRGRYRIV